MIHSKTIRQFKKEITKKYKLRTNEELFEEIVEKVIDVIIDKIEDVVADIDNVFELKGTADS